ncbi:hypothetical protein QBC37DRAFT_35698 [Rhypophila decipiens]|uniref:Zn(2)-C6 fungal-type domain-containing protein n=1 Tax=Rhypophila decipiens TaxID=261697 RepID=A0AAN7B6X3_9PEZI|nr:hypothetical protein QBC37DRAFT_35698 [Rhypophila decipiens]
MFGTLRYDRESHHAEFIDRTDSFLGDAATEHAACDKCRLTKLRCTGQRSGCDRCSVRGVQCVYSATGSRGSSKASKADGSVNSKVKKPPQKRRDKLPTLKTPGLQKRRETVGGKRQATSLRNKIDEATANQDKRDSVLDGVYEPMAKTEQSEQDMDRDMQSPPVYRVADVLSTWSHGRDPVLDVHMPPSPAYDGLPDNMVMVTGISSYHDPNQDGSVDDGSFAFFTSESPLPTPSESSPSSWAPSSEATSPMFTDSPASPQSDTTGLRMPFTVETDDQNINRCNCLSVISSMLEELDDLVYPLIHTITKPEVLALPCPSGSPNLDSAPTPTVDQMLGSLKTQMANANNVVQCSVCQNRGEHISLLIRACETMVRFAERIVLAYLGKRTQETTFGSARTGMLVPDSTPPPTPAASPSDGITMLHSVASDSHACGTASGLGSINPAILETCYPSSRPDPTTGANFTKDNLSGFINIQTHHLSNGDMFFGGYKTDPSEYEALMNLLIGLQLKGLVVLLASLLRQHPQGASTSVSLTTKQIARLHAAEGVVRGLIVRLEGTPQGFFTCT